MIKTKIFTEKENHFLDGLMFPLSKAVPNLSKIKSIIVEYEEFDWTDIYVARAESANLKLKLLQQGVPHENLIDSSLEDLKQMDTKLNKDKK